MSYKRSRSTFEGDNQLTPYAVFGTPLPDEAESRDDGAYKPLWKQDVRDERGRKRLHGAFTGGWSAGYVHLLCSAKRQVTHAGWQLLQYRWIQRRMDTVRFCIESSQSPQR